LSTLRGRLVAHVIRVIKGCCNTVVAGFLHAARIFFALFTVGVEVDDADVACDRLGLVQIVVVAVTVAEELYLRDDLVE
jgi:hypothetical protein